MLACDFSGSTPSRAPKTTRLMNASRVTAVVIPAKAAPSKPAASRRGGTGISAKCGPHLFRHRLADLIGLVGHCRHNDGHDAGPRVSGGCGGLRHSGDNLAR